MTNENYFTKESKFIVFLLRLFLGILFFYAGISKILTPNWSATSFLTGQATYGPFKEVFLMFANSPMIDFLVMYGLTLIGLALIAGLFVRLASFFGIIMMTLFYIPRFPPQNGLIDEHVIYSLVFLLFIVSDTSSYLGLKRAFSKTKFAKKNHWILKYL